jgi:hypothetical protein
MLMFSRFWNRIGDRWLVGRSASNMFAAAAILPMPSACAAHSCTIAAFGIALYSPWTGRGYFSYSAGNDIKYDQNERGIYYDELAKLVQARKTHWDLKGPGSRNNRFNLSILSEYGNGMVGG